MSLFDRVKWGYTPIGEPLTDVWLDGGYCRLPGHLDRQTANAIIVSLRRRCGEAA